MTSPLSFRAELLRDQLAMLVPLRIEEVRRSGIDPQEAIERLRGDNALLAAMAAGAPLPVSSPELEPLIMSEALVVGGPSEGRSLPAVVTALALRTDAVDLGKGRVTHA